jgi:hypothetical protein
LPCSSALAQQVDYAKLEITATDLGSGVHLLNWQGGDSLVLVGDDGVLVVDTSVAAMGAKIKAAIARLSAKPIKLVINTHSHADADTTTIQADLRASRDALVTIRSRVQTLIDEGKSEAEAIAAKPTKDLDARWAPRGGGLSGDVITRMAYQSVKGASAPARR